MEQIVTIERAVEIAKIFFKNIEDEITPYFYKKYEKYHLTICTDSNHSNRDQLLFSNSHESNIKYKFPQSIYHEIRLKFSLNKNLDEILFTVYNHPTSRQVGSYKITNPLMKYFIERCWNKDDRGYISTKPELRKAIQDSKVWSSFCDQKSISEPMSILLDAALDKQTFDFDGCMLFGMSGVGTYSYNKKEQTWNRVYGKPFVKIKENLKQIEVSHKQKNQ